MPHPIENPVLSRLVDRIRSEVEPDFDFLSPGTPPWCPMRSPVREARIALVTTAGLHLRGEPPFRALEEPLGDTSFRVIPADATASALDLAAPYVDPRHIPIDPEVALPLGALAALHREGLAGPATRRHASFTGGIVRPLPGLLASAERLAMMFREDGAGAVLLLPSCPLCVQTVCLLARELEAKGFPTVCLSLVPELSRIVGAPRSLAVRFRFGAPCGDPGNAPLHRAVLREALCLLEEATQPGTLRSSSLKWRQTVAD